MTAHGTLASASDLLERDHELATLTDALGRARNGAGSTVILKGPAGIGKSQLLRRAGGQAAQWGMLVLTARGTELEQDVPFGLAGELFAARVAAARTAARDRLFAGQARLAASLFEPAGVAADPQALVRGLYWLTVNAALAGGARRDGIPHPMVIVIDDAHWADRPSLAFVAHLAARVAGLPIALLVAVRTGEATQGDDLLRLVRQAPESVTLTPAPLSEAAVGALVERELPMADAEFVAACAHVSGGNPFMAYELSRALREEGVDPTARSAGRVQRLVPATVLNSVLIRLGRLGEAPRQIAGAIAVLGDSAPLRHAIALSGLAPAEAERAADRLAAAGVLTAEEPVRFVHPLIASAVYSDLPAFARARAHREAAELLAAEGAPVHELAAHLRLSRPQADAWTVSVLREAARRGLEQGDPDAAVRLLERALAEPPTPGERPDLLLELAQAEAIQGSFSARDHVAQALEQLTDTDGRARALRVMSRVRLVAGEHESAAVTLGELLDGLDPTDPTAEQILGEYLTIGRFTAPLHPEVSRRLQPILQRARRGSPPADPGLLAHVVLDLALAGERTAVVLELGERVTAADPLVELGSHGMPMGIVVQALCCVDELDAAEQIADAAVAAARRAGAFFAASVAHYHRAIPRYHRGTLADALADLDQALAPSREGWSTGSVWSQALTVHALIERGDLAAAAGTAAELGPIARSMDEPIAQFARARLALATRDPAAALADALAAGRLLVDQFAIDHPGFVPWRRTAALAASLLGDERQARELAAEQLELGRAVAVPRAIGLALRTASAVGERQRQVALLSEAAELLEHSPSALERAHALADLGAALRRSGRRADAQPPLRRALHLAEGMGALPLADAVRTELRATGARPRRAAFSGADALTPAERRVAQLAARGLTNPQIAQDLFVTTKTVQTHLAHAYRKLGITSRRELSAHGL